MGKRTAHAAGGRRRKKPLRFTKIKGLEEEAGERLRRKRDRSEFLDAVGAGRGGPLVRERVVLKDREHRLEPPRRKRRKRTIPEVVLVPRRGKKKGKGKRKDIDIARVRK